MKLMKSLLVCAIISTFILLLTEAKIKTAKNDDITISFNLQKMVTIPKVTKSVLMAFVIGILKGVAEGLGKALGSKIKDKILSKLAKFWAKVKRFFNKSQKNNKKSKKAKNWLKNSKVKPTINQVSQKRNISKQKGVKSRATSS